MPSCRSATSTRTLLAGTANLALVGGMLTLVGVGRAEAQPVTGLYVGAAGGANFLQDETVRLSPEFPGGKERFDVGLTGLGSVGYGFGNGFRVELEGNYRYNGVQHFLTDAFSSSAGGEQQNYGVMTNVLFDLDIGKNWIYPYFGAGAGYSWTRWDHVQDVASNYEQTASGTYGNFAYQGIFGLSFPIAFLPGLSATAEYRFLSVQGPQQFNASSDGTEGAFGPKPQGFARGNTDVSTDYNHSLLLGLRYELNPVPPVPPAAPAPAAAPAPEAARTYLIFFDWDRADLTDRARQIIGEAAGASTRVQTTRIEVDGYTDLSGTADYNQRLSVRRADAVEAELVRDGVQRAEISVQGFGETNPLVPTKQGVREPQNRRVEIILK